MTWIKCTDRLPEHWAGFTTMGGGASAIVIGLWTHDKIPYVDICVHIDYGNEDPDPADGWMHVLDGGGFDRCTSHGGKAPIAWMPMPELPVLETVK